MHPNMLLAWHNRGYFNPGQFHFAEFYTEPDSHSDVREEAGCQAKRKRTFPRSNAARQRRIQSNNHKIPRFQNHS